MCKALGLSPGTSKEGQKEKNFPQQNGKYNLNYLYSWATPSSVGICVLRQSNIQALQVLPGTSHRLSGFLTTLGHISYHQKPQFQSWFWACGFQKLEYRISLSTYEPRDLCEASPGLDTVGTLCDKHCRQTPDSAVPVILPLSSSYLVP